MMLMTMDPDAIVAFCADHPLDMKDALRQETLPGGKGNVASPTPVADAFFTLLRQRHGELPTQQEFAAYCLETLWADWFATLPDDATRIAFHARLYRNFYPSFIDSLHVWALLGTRYAVNGSLVFDRCLIDTNDDVVKKTDLLVYRGTEALRLALTTNTRAAASVNAYKHAVRGGHVRGTIELRMQVGKHLRGPGNKCWFYWPRDFAPVMRRAEQLWLLEPSPQGSPHA